MSDWVNDVNSEPPQAVTTESNIVAESSNLPAVPTITEVVQSSYPNQLAALAPGLNTLPSEPQLNITAVNFPRPVITNSSPPLHWLQSINYRHYTYRLQSLLQHQQLCPPPQLRPYRYSRTQQFVVPVTSQPLLTIPSSHAIPNLSAWAFPAGKSLPTTQYTAPPSTGGQFTFSSTVAAPIMTAAGSSVPVVPVRSGGTTY